MPEVLKINKGVEATIRELLCSLLASGQVSAVLSLGWTGGTNGGVAYSLFTDANAFGPEGAAQPLLPFMPANAGGLLSRLTLQGPLDQAIAAVVKPCELRAFIELTKRHQSSMENILLISPTCGGVYPLDEGRNGELRSKLPAYWEALKRGELEDNVRASCRSCAHFVPQNADIVVGLLGEPGLERECTLYLNSERAATLVQGLEGTAVPGKLESEAIQQSRTQRQSFREEIFEGVQTGLKGMIQTFGRCISCRACKTVCPICYCRLCYFDSPGCERTPQFYEQELEKRGGLRVPSDTMFFHLGRMAHMSVSCVACGMCTDVCPVDIPVSTIFAKVGAAAQAVFDYHPGRDVTEEIPMASFEQDEFAQVAT